MHNKKSILLVDDEKIILNSFARDLRQENYDVTLAANGEEAISLLQDFQFDLVVTDLSMPGLDGIQVLKETKKTNSLTGVIILTGYGEMDSAIDALRLGADDYLTKPCESEDLIFHIDRCLEKFVAFKKLKLYENILPICCDCGVIRDDTGVEHGKGTWIKIEKFLTQKTDLHLSHGLCPKCYAKAMEDI